MGLKNEMNKLDEYRVSRNEVAKCNLISGRTA